MDQTKRKATVSFGGDGYFIGLSPSGHAMIIETDGERNTGPSPMELLLIAVGSCTGVDVVSILQKKRQRVISYKVEVSADRREDHPRSIERLQVHHIISGHDISRTAVERAIALSDEKYCSVAATLRPAVQIETSYEIIEPPKLETE
jgi:putative redox protein